ncbi:phosphatase PAP2 family protein [Treponema sp. OMZ 840]|uniref:phosphatase PAP2 family protein n=1 Tax=Treponema sp. OMZ 840 TaxID=244313 RepID=UPI003D93F63C
MFSESVYEWGLQVIKTVQLIKSAPLTLFMKAVSFLSDPKAYTLFLPLAFLCIDEKRGMKLTMSVFFAGSLNTAIKNALKIPRPYIRDPSVGLDSVHGYSTPSGHSQSSASFWPYFIRLFFPRAAQKDKAVQNKTAVRVLKLVCAVGLPLLIGFSRVYLGVHYPSDVLMGLTLGFLFSAGLILFGPHIECFINRCARIFKILILGLITAGLNALSPADTSMNAAFFGFGFGYILLKEQGGFCASKGSAAQKILRLALCAAVCAPLFFVLKTFFPGTESAYYQLFRFLRYGIVSFCAGFVVPKLCIILRCAQPFSCACASGTGASVVAQDAESGIVSDKNGKNRL